MAQRLYARPIASTMVADQVFGKDPGLVVAAPKKCGYGCLPFMVIPEGYYALVTTSGREILHQGSCVWPSGFHWAGAFTYVSHLVTKSHVVFDAPVKGCKTSDNVTVVIDTALIFRVMGDAKHGENPELVRKFVHQVTPSGLEQQVKDALAEEIRSLARSLKHTQVYACRAGPRAVPAVPANNSTSSTPPKIHTDDGSGKAEAKATVTTESPLRGIELTQAGDKVADAVPLNEDDEDAYEGTEVTARLIERLNAQFQPQGVEIVDVLIQNVKLPDEIATQMSNKTLVRSKQEYERMEQQFEMQDISLKNEVEKKKLAYGERSAKMTAEGQAATKAASDNLTERKAVRTRELDELNMTYKNQVDMIKAETKEKTTALHFEKESKLQSLRLEAEEESNRLRAQADAAVARVKAEAKLTVANDLGAAKKVLAEAETKADACLGIQRAQQLRKTRLQVYEKLAHNDQVLITNTDDKDVNMMLLADNVLAANDSKDSHAGIVAELNLLRLASAAYGLQGGTYIPDGDSTAAPTKNGSHVASQFYTSRR